MDSSRTSREKQAWTILREKVLWTASWETIINASLHPASFGSFRLSYVHHCLHLNDRPQHNPTRTVGVDENEGAGGRLCGSADRCTAGSHECLPRGLPPCPARSWPSDGSASLL